MDEPKEYIERGAALLAITGQPSELHYPSWYKGNIMEVPAADVVEVVRCKDCKMGFKKFVKGVKVIECQRYEYDDPRQYKHSNDFCSYGERK